MAGKRPSELLDIKNIESRAEELRQIAANLRRISKRMGEANIQEIETPHRKRWARAWEELIKWVQGVDAAVCLQGKRKTGRKNDEQGQ